MWFPVWDHVLGTKLYVPQGRLQLEGQLKSARSELSETSVHLGISTNIF